MKKCPRCNSTKIKRVSNGRPVKGQRDHAGKVIGHAYRTGHPIVAALALAGKIAKETGFIDWLNDSWKCKTCGHSF